MSINKLIVIKDMINLQFKKFYELINKKEEKEEMEMEINEIEEINILNNTELTFKDYKIKINEIMSPYITQINKCKDKDDNYLLDFINQIPKVELHIHLEGMINDTIIKQFNNLKNIHIYENDKIFDKFNKIVDILCCDFENNMRILLNYVYEDRLKQNIYYTQFHLSSLKIHSLTNLTVKDQFDIIIDIINIIKQKGKYDNIKIQFILDIPRGDAYRYDYLNQYFIEIIRLSHDNKYKQYIIAVGIGGRWEYNTIDGNYKKYFEQIKDFSTLKIIPHAGEFFDTTTTCNSIKSALNYSKRIGHGVRIMECDHLNSTIDKSNIVLDINISSNLSFIDKYNNNLYNHPIKELLEEGYNITLSTDDPGILYSENNKNIDLLHEHKLLLEIIKTYSLKEKIDILFNISINSIFFCYYNNNNYANKLLLTILNYYIRLYNYCK